jgi:hypothetical protein
MVGLFAYAKREGVRGTKGGDGLRIYWRSEIPVRRTHPLSNPTAFDFTQSSIRRHLASQP